MTDNIMDIVYVDVVSADITYQFYYQDKYLVT
jgi:hypothetical protein